MMRKLLSVLDIYAGYNKRSVLQSIFLDVYQNDIILLMGPNGCGKTTLLKVIVGAIQPFSGEIIFRDKNILCLPVHLRVREGIGYLMQTNNIFPSLTVKENLRLSFRNKKKSYEESLEWALEIFSILKDKLLHRAGLLSGGERQFLAIAMILMQPVSLLILDEPTAGLSPKAADKILSTLHKVHETIGLTSIIVEHNTNFLHQWVTRVLVMNQGRVVAEEKDSSILYDHDRLERYYFK